MSDLMFEGRRVVGRQIAVVGLVFLVAIIAGMDVQLLALAAPQVLAEWSLSKAAFAPVLAAAVLGIVVGAASGGLAGDRWGRPPLIIASTLVSFAFRLRIETDLDRLLVGRTDFSD